MAKVLMTKDILAEFNKWRLQNNLAPLPSSSERIPRAIRVSKESWLQVVLLAESMGYRSTHGRTASGGSVSDLVEAIGAGLVTLEINNEDY